jgi:glycosyltransferase involved in cell wall biosynthesis
MAHEIRLVIVDDASPEPVYQELAQLLGRHAPDAMVLRHEHNQGKGGAVMTGLRAAFAAGYTHALQVDADGQHDVGAIPSFVNTAGEYPDSLICGRPVFDQSVSALRYYARYLTLYFCWLEILGTEIKDALCGFRLYPLARVVPIIDNCRPGKRMAFDPEILVRCFWDGIALRYIPVSVQYPEGGRSHFHYLGDNLELSWMHTRLIAGMLPRLPRLLGRRIPLRNRGTAA